MTWAMINEQYAPSDEIRVSASDRGLLLGDGLFETMRAYGGEAFRQADHLRRLSRSCEAMNLELPWSHEDLGGMIDSLIAKNELESARVRLTVTRGEHTGAMDLGESPAPTLLITAEPLPARLEDREAKPLTLASVSVRFSESNPIFRHKTLNRLPHLFARTEAQKAGADEALILDERGNVVCASTGNLFVLQNGQLFSAPLSAAILPGVTRRVTLELALAEGVPSREDFFSPLMLVGGDEIFMTNSVQELVPVVEVDGRRVGSGRPGPLTVRLRERYRELAEST